MHWPKQKQFHVNANPLYPMVVISVIGIAR